MTNPARTIIVGLALLLAATALPSRSAQPPGESVVQPVSPKDLAYLDQGTTIPWATQAIADAFVAHLKTYPLSDGSKSRKALVPKVPTDGWWTYTAELPLNNYYPDEVEGCAPAIADFKRQLDGLGIAFIFMPVPEGSMIYPDLYWDRIPLEANGLPPQVALGNQRLFAALDRLGVKSANLAPAMILARKESQRGHCRQFNFGTDAKADNSHWNSYGAVVSAHVLAAEIAKMPWYREMPKIDGLKAEWVAPKNYGPQDDSRGWQWERRISGQPTPLGESPIIVVGDSNMEAKRGFGEQLMYELKIPVEVMGGMGGDPSLIVRRAGQQPDWLLKKKLVVWSVANRTLGAGVDPKPSVPGGIRFHTIFPGGVQAAKTRAAALAGNPARFTATVTLQEMSAAKTPEQWQPYTAALIYGRFQVDSTRSPDKHFDGGYKPKTLMAAGWGLVDGKQTWLTKMNPGTRYQITVEAMDNHPELKEVAVDQTAFEDLSLPPYLIVSIQDSTGKPIEALPAGPANVRPATTKPVGAAE